MLNLIRYFAAMIVRASLLLFLVLLSSCYQPVRDCQAFKNGKFEFTALVEGEEMSTVFERQGDREIDYFQGQSDTSEVRWINDCEYVVRQLHPKNKSEERSIHMKILSTTEDSYTFEYSIVGDSKKSRGTAIKIK